MAIDGEIGYGATFNIFSGSAFMSIADVIDIKDQGIEIPAIDVTTNSSPGASRAYIPGLINSSPITLNMLYTQSGYNLLQAIARTGQGFKVHYADFGAETFSGQLTSVKVNTPLADKQTMDAVFQPSGVVSWLTSG